MCRVLLSAEHSKSEQPKEPDMDALKNKILTEGKAIGTEIVKVDGFLNHQIDVKFLGEIGEEFGILDLGSWSIRMYMFRGDRHIATRELEFWADQSSG